jgi:hypothetical protein
VNVSNGRRFRLVTIVLAAAALVATLAGTGTAAVGTSPVGEGTPEPKDTLDEDDYMRAYGVESAEEARRQWQVTDAAGELQVVLKKEYADVFGGLWVEYDPKFAIAVGVLEGHGKDVQPVIDEFGLTADARFQEVQKTLLELENDLDAVMAAAPFGVDYAYGIDQSEGRIKIFVDSGSDFQLFAATELPSSADLVQQGLPEPAVEVYGGLDLSNGCTSGFSVQVTSGSTEGVTTAGHCDNTTSYNGQNLPWQDGLQQDSTDAQWHTTPNLTDPNKIRVSNSGTTRNVTSRKPLNQMVEGENVCKYGRVTNFDCGEIDIVPYNPGDQCVDSSNNTYAFVIPNPNAGDMAEGGDSGGPVFHGNPAKAYGQVVCRDPEDNDQGRMVFMPRNFLPNIGVEVDIN